MKSIPWINIKYLVLNILLVQQWLIPDLSILRERKKKVDTNHAEGLYYIPSKGEKQHHATFQEFKVNFGEMWMTNTFYSHWMELQQQQQH